MQDSTSFNARLARGGRKYRIYIRGSDLYFIELGGVDQKASILMDLFGPCGALIREIWKRWAERKAAAALQRAESQDPEQLVRENKNSFLVCVCEIREAAIEPPARLALFGQRAGQWNFTRADGGKMQFEFESTEDMKTALSLLPPLLGATLQVNVEWDEPNKRFQGKKTPAFA